jgi:hypothetical protein
MTDHELDIVLKNLGLKVPEVERIDILAAIKFIEKMKILVRKPCTLVSESAHTGSFPRINNDF